MPKTQAVLITRPEPEAGAFADQMRTLPGVSVFKAPMTVVSPVQGTEPLPEADALLLTSPRATAHTEDLPRLPAFVVGEATAKAARDSGLKIEGIANGQADQSLIELVPSGTQLLHLSGAHLSRDLKTAFAERQVTLLRRVVYEATAVSEWPSTALDFLAFEGAKSVTFLSARAAEIFAAHVPNDEARTQLQETRALCASARIASAAEGAKLFSSVKILAAPDASSFVDFVSSGCT